MVNALRDMYRAFCAFVFD